MDRKWSSPTPHGAGKRHTCGTLLLGESASDLPLEAARGYGRIEALVFPDETILEVPAWSPNTSRGAGGLPGKVKYPFWKGFKAATLLGLTGGVFAAAADTNQATFGRADVGESIAAQTAAEYQQLSSRILNRFINLPATVETRAGTRFFVQVQHRFDLGQPWAEAR